MRKIIKNKKGFSFIEIVIYLGVFSIILASSINAIFIVLKTYNNFQVMKIIRNDAEIALERLTKETKLANNIDVRKSVLDANPGTLYLNSVDESGSPKTIEFFLDDGALVMEENGGFEKFLTSSSTIISNLIFNKIQNASTSQAVKIKISAGSKKGKFEKMENFYATAILKNSYDK